MLSWENIWPRPEVRPSPSVGLEDLAIQHSCSGLHLERTQDSFSPYQHLLHFPRVFLDLKVVIVKTEVQLFASEYEKNSQSHVSVEQRVCYISYQKPKNTVGYDCTGIIVLDSNRVQLFPQILLSCNTAERKNLTWQGASSVSNLDNMVRESK